MADPSTIDRSRSILPCYTAKHCARHVSTVTLFNMHVAQAKHNRSIAIDLHGNYLRTYKGSDHVHSTQQA